MPSSARTRWKTAMTILLSPGPPRVSNPLSSWIISGKNRRSVTPLWPAQWRYQTYYIVPQDPICSAHGSSLVGQRIGAASHFGYMTGLLCRTTSFQRLALSPPIQPGHTAMLAFLYLG